MASASVYSCGTCRVKFPTLELMQSHYKCDWHRYNLKRKVATLPPISAESFAEIVKAYQQEVPKTSTDSADSNTRQTDKLYCKECAKNFQNAGSLASHLESRKHLEAVKNYTGNQEEEFSRNKSNVPQSKETTDHVNSVTKVEDSEMNDEDDWEDEEEEGEREIPPYDVSVCLFCDKKSASLEASLSHMSTAHSFFIPDFEYCCDLEGLVDYLGKKVTDGNLCLFCNQRFHDTLAVQRHMESKGHRKMGYEGDYLLEYEDFYDFSTPEEEGTENTPAASGDEEGVVLDGTGFEMTLPSGVTIGHRDLRMYYKQSLRPGTDVALLGRVRGHYKALGWNSNEKGMGYAKNMIKELNRLHLNQQKKRLHVGMQTNKIMMKHYRREYGF